MKKIILVYTINFVLNVFGAEQTSPGATITGIPIKCDLKSSDTELTKEQKEALSKQAENVIKN